MRTMIILSFGLVSEHAGMVLVAALECAISLCFATGRFLRIGVWLLAFQKLGAMSLILLFPRELFAVPYHAPTLVAQYIIKDVVLVAEGMLVVATWTGARIVTELPSIIHYVHEFRRSLAPFDLEFHNQLT